MVNRNQPVNSRRLRTGLIAVIALFPALMLANFFAPRIVPSVEPTVSIDPSQTEGPSNVRTASAPARLPDDGEVYRTADRLREASALALAVTLYAASEESTGDHSAYRVDSIVGALRSRGLLPPGITSDAPAMLRSDLSTLQLRFRPYPLAIEVISFAQSRNDGPALMVRLPGSGSDNDRGSVLFAEHLGDITAPAPFASLPDCIRAGWIDQPINQTDTPHEQEEQLRAWLTSRRAR